MNIFGTIRNWRDRRVALKELQGIQREEEPYSAFETQRLLDLLQEAVTREDPAFGIRCWNQLNVLNRDVATTSGRAIDPLIGLGLHDMAEQASRSGMEKFPADAVAAENFANAAQHRGDLEEAVTRWARVRQKFPDRLRGYRQGGECLRWLNRTDEADTLLAEAVSKYPQDYDTAAAYAGAAEHAGKWEEALTRWTRARSAFANAIPWVQSAVCLQRLFRHTEAEELLLKASTLYVGNQSILTNLAGLARHRRDWPEALRRWALVRDLFPRATMGYLGAAWTYEDMGMIVEADAMMTDGIDRNEEDAGLAIEYARAAHARADWEEAIRRWAIVRERFPNRHEGYDGGAAALRGIGRVDEAEQIATSRLA